MTYIQRDIRFKIWDSRAKIWINNDGDKAMPLWSVNGEYWLEGYCPWIFIQYTGFKDKNHTPVYEGDILRNVNDDIEDPDINIDPVIWEDGCWQIDGMLLSDYVGEGNKTLLVDDEIIGNIFENPELLKK